MTLKQDMKVYYETFPESLKYCDWCGKSFRTVAALRARVAEAETYRKFWQRYAMPPKARPSCLVCGRVPEDWPPADEAAYEMEAARKAPSWRRVCKSLLRNDYWCKGLGFSQHKSEAYKKYLALMERRKKELIPQGQLFA